MLTRQEAAEISKSAASVEPRRPETKKLKLSSRIQLQYEWTDSSLVSGRGTNSNSGASSFLARRIFIQADADLGGGWTAQFGLDLARTQANCFLIDNYVAKSIEGEYIDGTLYLGYMKPQFIYEETTSSFELSAIERSPATMFWSGAASSTRMGVGNRYAGVRWNGNVRQVPGLAYILSVTNSYQLSPTDGRSPSTKLIDNSLAYWFSASYTMKGKENPWKLKIGAYSMYSSSANRDNNSAIYSINPYVAGNWGNFNFWAEYIGSVVVSHDESNSLYPVFSVETPEGAVDWRAPNEYTDAPFDNLRPYTVYRDRRGRFCPRDGNDDRRLVWDSGGVLYDRGPA